MSVDDDQDLPRRRPWRTDAEWARLRERIAAADAESAGTIERPVAIAVSRRTWVGVWSRRVAYAASLVAVTVGGTISVITLLRSSEAHRARVASTGVGQRSIIRLPDSSTVVLGPLSTLRYVHGPSRREMQLIGVARFQVTHDASHPFVVRTGSAETVDLGTEFVVRAYRGEPLEVAVASGSVAVKATHGNTSAATLRAGQIGTMTADGVITVQSGADTEARTAWADGRLVFDDASLASVAVELERWFGVRVEVRDSAIARRRVSAMQNDPSLTGMLDALSATLGVRWDRSADGHTIVIRAR